MRLVLILVFSFSLLFSSSLNSKIKHSRKQLSSKNIQYKKMDKKLSLIAKKILSAKKEQKILAKKLNKLAENIKNNEAKFSRLRKKEKKITVELNSIGGEIEKKEKKFLDLIAKNFSLALALDELKQPTPDSVMMKEAYKIYAKENSKEIEGLEKDIEELRDKKSMLKLKQSQISKRLEKFISERKEFQEKKVQKDKLVKNLAIDKAIYEKRFNKIKASRRSLERKLANLKIIKRKNDKSEKERVNKDIFVQNRASNSSVKYRDRKTISPLKGARLIKRYGTYIDPIYKFKIFNKSITLKAPYAGAKVRSVLAGRIVFAENSGGMLGKVVIVEHNKGIHTIYAKLSRLAPGIRVGKKVSRKTVIGKVEKSLMFEVTKNNKHINPMKLIRL